MSNRFHNKYHRHNHHTDPTSGPLYPDSAYDPIASRQSPFKGEFYADDQITSNDSLSARINVYATNAQISGNVVVDNNLTIHGESQFDGAVNIDDTFTVNGPSTLNGTLNVNGNTTLNGTLVTNLDALFNSNVEVIGNLTVQSNLNVLGTTTTLDTEVVVTSAMEITNNNTGPALQVVQTGEYPVAHFLDEGNTSLIIQGTGGAPGYVGINTATPNQRLTVIGNVSAKGDGYFEDLFISGNEEILGSLKVWEGIVVDANSNNGIALSANGDIHISNNNVLQFGYFPAVNDGAQIFFQSDNVDYGRLIIQTIDNADSTIVLRQYDQGPPVINYNRLVIGSDGNVGIGTGTLTAIETFPARLTVYGTLSTSDNITTYADLAVNGGDITTTAATFNLVNTNATALNIGGAATAVSLGNAAGTVTIPGDLAVNGGDITTTSNTGNVFNTNATALNIGGAATTIEIGKVDATTTVNINGTEPSTAYNNGALVVDGGVGVAGSIYTQNNLNSIQWSNATTKTQSNSAVWDGLVGNVVPLSGGTMTGSLTVNPNLNVVGTLTTGSTNVSATVVDVTTSKTFTDADNNKIFHFDTTTLSLCAIFPSNLSNGFNVGLMNSGTNTLQLSTASTYKAVGSFINTQYGGAFVYKQSTNLFAVGRLV